MDTEPTTTEHEATGPTLPTTPAPEPPRPAASPALAKILGTEGIIAAGVMRSEPGARLEIRSDHEAQWRPIFEQTLALYAKVRAMPSDKTAANYLVASYGLGAAELGIRVQVERDFTFVTVKPKGHPVHKSEKRLLRRLGTPRRRRDG